MKQEESYLWTSIVFVILSAIVYGIVFGASWSAGRGFQLSQDLESLVFGSTMALVSLCCAFMFVHWIVHVGRPITCGVFAAGFLLNAASIHAFLFAANDSASNRIFPFFILGCLCVALGRFVGPFFVELESTHPAEESPPGPINPKEPK